MAKPRCTSNTKKGTRCQNAPVKGTKHCISHSDKETRESAGFGGPQPNAGRPANPKPSEVARKLIEDNVLALQRPYWNALGYDVVIDPETGPKLVELANGGAKLYGTSKFGDVCVSDHEDLGAMIAAAEKLQDRVYGKPKQVQELTGPEGGPVVLELPDDAEERSARAAALLKKHGRLDGGD